MPKFLMTHSLLSAWLYAIKDNPYDDATSECDPMAEFMQVLRREPTETTAEMQKGKDFEDLVTAIVNGAYKPEESIVYDRNGNPEIEPNSGEPMITRQFHKWFNAAQKVAAIASGGQLQYKAYQHISVAGMDFVLYGRLDCLKAGTIYDIKFSSGYERGKFFGSTQHPTYMEIIPEAERFVYIVSNGAEVWTETYRREEVADIKPIIADFMAWLDTVGLLGTYKEHWRAAA